MNGVRPSDRLWKEGGGYYTQSEEELIKHPLLPDFRRLRDWRLLGLFKRHANLSAGSAVLEVGCGRSPWLPYLASHERCVAVGIDIEPFAAQLARANLAGSGAKGDILCRDAFDLKQNEDLTGRFDLVYSMGVIEHFDDADRRLAVLARYLRPEGCILTTVPNLQGVNWALQRLADRKLLEMHVIYDAKKLARVHEAAGFHTIAAGYVGFFDGYLTSTAGVPWGARRRIHHWLCWACNMGSAAWVRVINGVATPELSWAAPLVFYVGRHT